MHPLLAPDRLRLYLAAWIPIAGLLAVLAGPSSGRTWTETLALTMPLAILCAFMCLGSWSLCRTMPLARTHFSRLALAHGAAALVSSGLWVLLGLAWAHVLARLVGDARIVDRYVPSLGVLFPAGVLLFLLSAAVHYLLITFEASRAAERSSYELEVLAREARLKTLTAQINPHFLFNSLNAISALAGSEPEAARRMCQLLAEFFRATLALGSRRFIPLEEELRLTRSFLDIEKTRFQTRLSVEIELDPASEPCLVPPLILQPLVENAVVHGIAHLLEGGVVRVSARRDGAHLELRVTNPQDSDRPPSRGVGHGLVNVRDRTAALYGPEARLDIENTGTSYTVTVRLPAQVDETVNRMKATAGAGPTAGPVPVDDPAGAAVPDPTRGFAGDTLDRTSPTNPRSSGHGSREDSTPPTFRTPLGEGESPNEGNGSADAAGSDARRSTHGLADERTGWPAGTDGEWRERGA